MPRLLHDRPFRRPCNRGTGSVSGPQRMARVLRRMHPAGKSGRFNAGPVAMQLRSTSACAVDGAWTQLFNIALVFGSRLMAGAIRGVLQRTRSLLYYKGLSGRCTSLFPLNTRTSVS